MVRGLSAEGVHSAAVLTTLSSSQIWGAYKDQKHDLFLPTAAHSLSSGIAGLIEGPTLPTTMGGGRTSLAHAKVARGSDSGVGVVDGGRAAAKPVSGDELAEYEERRVKEEEEEEKRRRGKGGKGGMGGAEQGVVRRQEESLRKGASKERAEPPPVVRGEGSEKKRGYVPRVGFGKLGGGE